MTPEKQNDLTPTSDPALARVALEEIAESFNELHRKLLSGDELPPRLDRMARRWKREAIELRREIAEMKEGK